MCPNLLMERSLLPDCYIANRVILFSVLQTLQTQERRSEDVDIQLRDRYDVFRQVLPNYPLPEQNNQDITIYVEGDDDNLTVSISMPSPEGQSGDDSDPTSTHQLVTMSASVPRSVLNGSSD
ncbi:uncharacterized protein Dana_GF19701 [Drosophila ananassae]|uniref:Uncharacterized protein n=1 Tax=Drosophila ananassae TaxID=7217 RepID=B3MNQ1_DROAN|nr:uncharacterized protein LOC6502449 [Drosophila ananassae]EDV31138.1 uncharacterized protein Dana_GF19701 [Drosophila ananassae]